MIDLGVEDPRHEASANSLDLVRPRVAPGQHRALTWLHSYDVQVGVLRLEVLPCACDGAACAHPTHQHIRLHHSRNLTPVTPDSSQDA